MRNRRIVVLLIAGTFLASLLSAQRPRGPEIRVSPIAGDPGVAAMAANGDFVLIWQAGSEDRGQVPHVWYQPFRADGAPKGKPRRVSNSRASEQYPRITVGAGGSFVIVWEGGPFEDTSVFGRRFNADGSPRGGRFRLNANTAGKQYAPTVALAPDGSFVVAWTTEPFYYSDESSDVYARRFDAAGQPLGPDFLVNNVTTLDEQLFPAVTMSASGDFVILWDSWTGEGTFFDVYARRFAANGIPQGDEFPLTEGPTSEEWLALWMAGDGAFVVLWGVRGNEPVPYFTNGIFGQRFAASGKPIGKAFRFDLAPQVAQQVPAIVLAPDGNFFAAWISSAPGPEPVPAFIVGRRFARDGAPLGGDLRISLSATSDVGFPSIALGRDGRGIVVWRQGDAGIFARRLVP